MTNLYAFITYVVFTTFTPGPNNVMSMTNAAHHGYRRTLGFILGISSGFFIVMFLSGVLNVFLVGLVPQIKGVLNWVGAAYMVYLALHILFSKPSGEKNPEEEGNNFLTGFSMQFINVKSILYGITVYSSFIVQAYQDLRSVSMFAPFLTLVGFASCSSWALGGDIFRKFLNRYEKIFNAAMAALLIYTAAASLMH